MNELNICLVYPGYPPYEYQGGGISSVAYELTKGLVNNGQKVTVISRVDGIDEIIKKQEKNHIIFFIPSEDKNSTKVNPDFSFKKFGNYLFSQKVYSLIRKIEDSNKRRFDVIEFCDWGAEGYVTIKKFPAKTIIRCSTPSFISETYNQENPPYLSNFVKDLEKDTILNAKNISTNSASLVQKIEGFCGKKLKYRHLEIPLSFKCTMKKSNYSFNKNRRMKILLAGRVENRKGFDLVIKVLPILENLRRFIFR